MLPFTSELSEYYTVPESYERCLGVYRIKVSQTYFSGVGVGVGLMTG